MSQERASGQSPEPNGSAVKCSTVQVKANPTRPSTALAMTAAEAGPPTRLCNMNMMLNSTTGNTASMPLAAGPS